MAPDIPKGWLDYTPLGRKVSGTRFVAFKVPLRENVVSSVPSSNRLSCEILLQKIPNLGMIIDLTNTYRYYDPETFEANGVKHMKLMIPGQTIPDRRFVQEFIKIVNSFLEKNADNNKLIGVHCTHGVNRTGYLISSFMISEMKMTPEKAIEKVEHARGHSINRENYKNDLKFNHGDDYTSSNCSEYDNSRTRDDQPEIVNKNSRNPFRSRYGETSTVATNYENWRSRSPDNNGPSIERFSHQHREQRKYNRYEISRKDNNETNRRQHHYPDQPSSSNRSYKNDAKHRNDDG